MSKITVAFIKAAMVYFIIAMLIGIHMSTTGAVYPSMPVHVHFNLLGWMSMMVYGVAYHILPRFSGRPLWNEKLSVWHFWLANIGLIGMALGWSLIGGPGGGAVLYIFSLVEGVSIILFATNMFKTVKAATPPPPRPPARPAPPSPAPPATAAKAAPATKAGETTKKDTRPTNLEAAKTREGGDKDNKPARTRPSNRRRTRSGQRRSRKETTRAPKKTTKEETGKKSNNEKSPGQGESAPAPETVKNTVEPSKKQREGTAGDKTTSEAKPEGPQNKKNASEGPGEEK